MPAKFEINLCVWYLVYWIVVPQYSDDDEWFLLSKKYSSLFLFGPSLNFRSLWTNVLSCIGLKPFSHWKTLIQYSSSATAYTNSPPNDIFRDNERGKILFSWTKSLILWFQWGYMWMWAAQPDNFVNKEMKTAMYSG